MFDFEHWLKNNEKLIYYMIRKIDSTLVNDEDLYQEILIDLWKASQRFDDSRCTANTYFGVCIQNAVLKYVRKRRTFKESVNHDNISLYSDISVEDRRSIDLVDVLRGHLDILFIDFDYLRSKVSKKHLPIVLDFMEGATQEILTRKYKISQGQVSKILSKYTDIIKESIISG